MLIAIDTGNTNTVIAVYENECAIHNWRLYTDHNKTADEYSMILMQLMSSAKIPIDKIEAIIISSVVPTLTETLAQMSKILFHLEPVIVGINAKLNMKILYDSPDNLGADRIVNAAAALEKYQAPAIIVDLGTAVTIDVIDRNGNFVGGIISAGIKTTSDALSFKTSKLPKIKLTRPESVIGTSTNSCILSGLYYGTIGMIDGIIEKCLEELKEKPEHVQIIATGGFSGILKESKYIKIIDENLLLDGLRIIYQQNKKG